MIDATNTIKPENKRQRTAVKTTIAILFAMALIVLLSHPKYHSGTVVEKQGQLPPIISEYLLDYGWAVVDNPQSPDPEGWYVLVQDGTTYMSHRLTAKQYEQVQLGATLVCIGPLTWWANP